jgi:hypothetical protein
MCAICEKEDLFSYVTQEGVCAQCVLAYNIPGVGHPQARAAAIEAVRKIRKALELEAHARRFDNCPRCGASPEHQERRWPQCLLCNPADMHLHKWEQRGEYDVCSVCDVEYQARVRSAEQHAAYARPERRPRARRATKEGRWRR